MKKSKINRISSLDKILEMQNNCTIDELRENIHKSLDSSGEEVEINFDEEIYKNLANIGCYGFSNQDEIFLWADGASIEDIISIISYEYGHIMTGSNSLKDKTNEEIINNERESEKYSTIAVFSFNEAIKIIGEV